MHLSLNEEQQLLQDSVSRYVEENYGIERLRRLRDGGEALDNERWQQFAELGWLALPAVPGAVEPLLTAGQRQPQFQPCIFKPRTGSGSPSGLWVEVLSP